MVATSVSVFKTILTTPVAVRSCDKFSNRKTTAAIITTYSAFTMPGTAAIIASNDFFAVNVGNFLNVFFKVIPSAILATYKVIFQTISANCKVFACISKVIVIVVFAAIWAKTVILVKARITNCSSVAVALVNLVPFAF